MPRPKAYALALAIVLAAWLIRLSLQPLVHGYLPFQLFVIACMLIQFLVGMGPALMAAGISLVLGLYWFVEPYGKWGSISRGDFIISCNFVLVTLVTIFLIETLRRSLYSAQLWARVAESRYLTAMRRENERLYAAKQRPAVGGRHGAVPAPTPSGVTDLD